MEVIDISKIIDLTNQKFGKLTVIKKTENPNSKKNVHIGYVYVIAEKLLS